MTIEAGALALRITEVGADQVLAKLDKIDQKAAALGKAVFNAPSATGVNGQLQQMSVNFTKVGQAAAASAPALEKQAAAQAKVATTAAAIGAETSALGKAAAGFGAVAGALGAIGIAVSAGAILASLVGLVREAIDAGDALHDLAMRTGVSTENLSVFQQVAAKSGADSGTLAVGFRNLAKEVEKLRAGNKDATAAFAALGLSAQDLAGLSLDQVFVKVANAQERFADGAGKTAAIVQIFGRAGDALIPTLHELADGGFERARDRAEALGGVISDEFANKSDAFNDQLEDLHTALRGLGMVIADPLLPFLTRMADLFTTLIVKAQNFGSVVENMLVRTPLGALAAVVNGLLPQPFTRMGPTMEQLKSGRALPDVPTMVKPTESAEDRERKRALAKAMGVDITSLGEIGLTAHGPAGPLVDPTVGLDRNGKMKGVKDAGKIIDPVFDALEAKMKERMERLQGLVGSIAQGVGQAFGNAFTAAFEGGNFFAEFGKGLISSLGNIIMQLGEQMLAYGLIIAPLASLLNFTPFGSLGMGAGASIAAGLALTALGAAMGAVGGHGGKGAGGGSGRGGNQNGQQDNTFALQFDPDGKLRKRAGPAVVPSSRALNNGAMPDARANVTVNATIIGPDDPKAQRQIGALIKNASDRGIDMGMRKAG